MSLGVGFYFPKSLYKTDFPVVNMVKIVQYTIQL